MARFLLASLSVFFALSLLVNYSTCASTDDGLISALQLDPSECPAKCDIRCANTKHRKDYCLSFCIPCCQECLCVPPGQYGNRDVCPCYRDKKTKEGKPKCP